MNGIKKKKILSDSEKIRKSDELFTEALISLESHKWDKCNTICNEILDISISIEQRLATMLLIGLANSKNEKNVKNYLEEAYSYED